jgi:hypothetical protein
MEDDIVLSNGVEMWPDGAEGISFWMYKCRDDEESMIPIMIKDLDILYETIKTWREERDEYCRKNSIIRKNK